MTKENGQELDKIIHQLVKVNYKNCPQTWKEIKQKIAEDQQNFIAKPKATMKNLLPHNNPMFPESFIPNIHLLKVF